MTVQAVPAPRRAMARLAFIRALATQTDAIRELRAWRFPPAELHSELEQGLREIDGGHPFFSMAFRPSRASLFDLAGEERVREASAWAVRWKLDVWWLKGWATFALLVWDMARSCTLADCRYGCRVVRDDEHLALEQVLTEEAMLAFGEDPLLLSILAAMQAEEKAGADVAAKPIEELLPIHMRAVVKALPGPHPVVETKEEFFRRAGVAWEQAVAALVKRAVSTRLRVRRER